jgi:zinc transport system substrate-binding protein
MRTCSHAILVALALGGCAGAGKPARPVVLVSVPAQAFLVERLAGDLVDVALLVPPGANLATYEPGVAEMRAASHASLYVRVGHPHFAFERAWFDRVIADNPGLRVVDAIEGSGAHVEDPHVWTSPRCMRALTTAVASALTEELPDRADEIAFRAQALGATIDSLELEVAALLAPYRGRRFFVFHAAWGYFADDYGLEQVAIELGHREPSAADLEGVIEAARAEGVKTIFVQPQLSDRAARLVADAVGARVEVADPLAADWPASIRGFARSLAESFE